MKKYCILILLLSNFLFGKAEKVYDFNAVCQQAYNEITQLKLNNGLLLIAKAKQQNPNNLIPYVLESYADFFSLFFNEDHAEYKAKKDNFDKRIKLLKEGPESSPLHRFCLSAVYIHKAAIEIRFGELWSAGWDGRRAYSYIKENNKLFPAFTPNKFLLGSLQTVVGTIPKSFRWVAGLFGMTGSVTEGMKTVRQFVNGNDVWSRLMVNESAFGYCYLMFYLENNKEEALKFIQTRKLDLVNNHLMAFMASNLAVNSKQPELAKSIILNRNKSLDYLQTPMWDYELGLAKIYHLDTQEALVNLESFANNFKGNFYKKDVYQKISWAYYLQGNMKAAEAARTNVINKGASDADADKQALRDAKKGKWPNVLLLKARLLNDGGYNKEALQLLQGKTVNSFTKEEEQLEFVYRLGRLYDDVNNSELAIQYYNSAIKLGEKSTEYYAARAALQIGMIYEKRGDKKSAIHYYEICIGMDDHDYKTSLDQRAKSGIARCKGE
jgi:tetratricopeptide (TPR) repeat protein